MTTYCAIKVSTNRRQVGSMFGPLLRRESCREFLQGSAFRTWNCVSNFAHLIWCKLSDIRVKTVSNSWIYYKPYMNVILLVIFINIIHEFDNWFVTNMASCKYRVPRFAWHFISNTVINILAIVSLVQSSYCVFCLEYWRCVFISWPEYNTQGLF